MEPNDRKLTWQEIRKQYDGEWVQLVEYDWPDGEPYPAAGRVQFHAAERKQFDALSREHPADDAACIFVGRAGLPIGTILSANVMRIRLYGPTWQKR